MLIIDTTCAPTEALDLRADALAAWAADLDAIAHRLVYIRQRMTAVAAEDVAPPFTLSEVAVIHAAVRELAGRVRAEQGG